MSQFKPLLTLSVQHAYYNGSCLDVTFVVPDDTTRALKNGKLLSRTLDGKFYILYEADAQGAAVAPLPGRTLRVGLCLNNPFFSNFTALGGTFSSTLSLYRNVTAPDTLDAPLNPAPSLVGQIFSHTLTKPDRPVTVALTNAAGQVIQTDTITDTNSRPATSYDLTGQPAGLYTVQETYAAGLVTISYYSDAQLLGAGVFGIVEINVPTAFYNQAPALTIPFAAKAQTLRYYVVAANYSNADLQKLSVTDVGYADDGRPQINFDTINSGQFTAQQIPPSLLSNNPAQVVLFQSKAAVPRSAQAPKKLQLNQNGDVLITNLPQPGPNKSTSDIIIPLSK